MVKKPPANAEDTDSIPSQGTKIPRAVGQLRPRPTTTKPMHHSQDPVQQKNKRKKKKKKRYTVAHSTLPGTQHAHNYCIKAYITRTLSTTDSLQKESVRPTASPSSRVCSQWDIRLPPLQPSWTSCLGFPVTSSCQI